MRQFRQFVVARTPEEATDLKSSIGPEAMYVAGGTGLVPFVKTPIEVLIDVSKLGFTGIVRGGNKTVIGATTRIADLMAHELRAVAPILCKAVRRLGTPLVRNAATVGGNLVYAFLPSDLTVGLLATGAGIQILGESSRTIQIEKLLDDGWLGGNDLISKITLAKPDAGSGTGFAKFGRGEVDIGLVNAAVLLKAARGKVEDLRIAVGQSSTMPEFLRDAAQEVRGEKISRRLIDGVAGRASESVRPRDDYRASAEYRKHLVRVMVGRALVEAASEAGVEIED